MNLVTLIGNLTKDPELRTTPNGVSVCSFTIAVNRYSNGEKVSDFYRINAWRKDADNCMKYLAKGRKVAVCGSLEPRTYTNSKGEKVTSLDVQATDIEFLSPREEQKQERQSDPKEDWTPVQGELPF